MGVYVPSFPFPLATGQGLTGEGIGKSIHGKEQNLDVIYTLELHVDQVEAGTLPEVTLGCLFVCFCPASSTSLSFSLRALPQ